MSRAGLARIRSASKHKRSSVDGVAEMLAVGAEHSRARVADDLLSVRHAPRRSTLRNPQRADGRARGWLATVAFRSSGAALADVSYVAKPITRSKEARMAKAFVRDASFPRIGDASRP